MRPPQPSPPPAARPCPHGRRASRGRWTVLVGGLISVGAAGQARAQTPPSGTAAGTNVVNQATATYKVDGTAQPALTSNSDSFAVDRRVNFVIAETSGAVTESAPASTAQVTSFRLTNVTNATMDFRLFASQQASGTRTAFGKNDDFDPSNLRVRVDADGDGVYDAGVDVAEFVDELGADASVVVFILGDMASDLPSTADAGVILTGRAAAAGGAGALGADMVPDDGVNRTDTVDTVFGDAAGTDDGARDGAHSARDAYDIKAARLAIVKSSKLVSDPVNGVVDPKNVPGALIEYCVTVANTGDADADAVGMTDPLPAGLIYQAGSLFVGTSVTAGMCNADGSAEDDDAVGADEADPTGGGYSAGTVRMTLATVPRGETRAARFRVVLE